MWRPVNALVAGRLAYLHFENAACSDCLGYVNGTGFAEWPETVKGQRPDGWCDASEMLLRPAVSAAHPAKLAS